MTGMGRSFYRLTAEQAIEDLSQGNPFYHEASGRHFEITQHGGRYYQLRYQFGPDGERTNLFEKTIDFVMGSGNHARTYLHLTSAGKLAQLPLGWYSDGGGKWAMSPGYDRLDHPGFQRAVSYDCMFCHTGDPITPPGQDAVGHRPLFREPLSEGIDCQRCHGPGGITSRPRKAATHRLRPFAGRSSTLPASAPNASSTSAFSATWKPRAGRCRT